MTIAFISDLHLSAERPSSISLFCDFMEKSGCLLESLYILGDLFDYWIGDDASSALGFDLAEQAIKNTTDSGTAVYFIAGNRDFLLGRDFAERTGMTLLKDKTVLEIADQRVMIAHGDQFCTDDTSYLATRAQFLAPEWQRAFLQKSLAERKAIALDLRAQSEVSKKHKPDALMDVNQDEIQRVIESYDLDILIHGHTHRPYVHQLEQNGKPCRRYVLGEWTTDRSVMYGNAGKYYLKK